MVNFSNGFEEGDFSAWTGTNGTPTIIESPTHHGHYAMEIDTVGEYARIAVADNNTLHVRCYFRLEEVPAPGDVINLIDIVSTFWGPTAYVQIIDDSIGYACQFPGRGDWIAVEWHTGQWYCVELKIYRDDVEGELRFWFDGVEVSNWTDLDTSGIPVGYFIMFGNHRLGGVSYTLQIDDCAVDNTYIGVEEHLIPVMMNHYRRINKIIRG